MDVKRGMKKHTLLVWGPSEQAHSMDVNSFSKLHDTFDDLEYKFSTERSSGMTLYGSIHIKLRLSAAIHHFSGGSPHNVMLIHGMSCVLVIA